jgi:hypothetical protein
LIARCCDGSCSVNELEFLYEHDREITKKTFARHVDMESLCEYLGYSHRHINRGLSFFKDWHIRCFVSKFRNRKVYHLIWSEIDHIFGQGHGIGDQNDFSSIVFQN